MPLNYNLLPKVWPSNIEKGLGYRELADRYQAMEKAPLLITGQLLTGYAPALGDALHLDGIIAAAVLASHPCPAQYPKGAAIVPLPLQMLWTNEDGWPLWASSDLVPQGEAIQSREYWHKRYPTHRADLGGKMNANTSAGRWREYRVPITTVVTDRVQALAIGNLDEVRRLLGHVSHIGKKGAAGYGRVQWDVQPATMSDQDALLAIHTGRALPIGYAAEQGISGTTLPVAGWTPPYWYAPNHCGCIVPSSS